MVPIVYRKSLCMAGGVLYNEYCVVIFLILNV